MNIWKFGLARKRSMRSFSGSAGLRRWLLSGRLHVSRLPAASLTPVRSEEPDGFFVGAACSVYLTVGARKVPSGFRRRADHALALSPSERNEFFEWNDSSEALLANAGRRESESRHFSPRWQEESRNFKSLLLAAAVTRSDRRRRCFAASVAIITMRWHVPPRRIIKSGKFRFCRVVALNETLIERRDNLLTARLVETVATCSRTARALWTQ